MVCNYLFCSEIFNEEKPLTSSGPLSPYPELQVTRAMSPNWKISGALSRPFAILIWVEQIVSEIQL